MAPNESHRVWVVGDRVCHADGGPEMEVSRIVGRSVWCSWTANNRKHTRVFPADELYPARPNAAEESECITLQIGMMVQHLSGGPRMKVAEIVGHWAWCQWVHQSHPQSRQFPCAELVEVVQAESGGLAGP